MANNTSDTDNKDLEAVTPDTGGAALPAADTAPAGAAVVVPDNVRVWRNGVWQDMNTKKIIKGPDRGKETITKDNSAELRARYEAMRIKGRLAALGGLIGLDDSKPGILAGWRYLVRKQAELATETDRGMASVAAAQFVGKATGLVAERGQDAPASGAVTITVGAAALHRLLQAVGGAPVADDRDTIDARFSDE